MAVLIGRFPEGVTLNPLEYLKDSDGLLMKFEDKEKAEKFLIDSGENLEAFTFEEVFV